MDYKIVLKNLKITDDIREETELRVEELLSMSSTFDLTKFYISKINNEYVVKMVLSRENDTIQISSLEFKNNRLSIAMEQAKESVIEEIMKELIMESVA